MFLMHSVLVNFISRLVVAKKSIWLTNRISPLILMLLLALIISQGAVIYSVTPVYVLVQMVLPFSPVMVVPYIFSSLVASSKVTGQFMIRLDLNNFLKSFWDRCPTFSYIPLDNLALFSWCLM